MSIPPLTDSQLRAIMITERVNSCISIVAITFVFTTYAFCPAFQKPINRLIFFATWGNLGFIVACLISVDGYRDVGTDKLNIGTLCRFQSFMVQMFNDVDVYWAACMAFNVYLAFFRGWSIDQLRALEIRYFIATYGLSFIPAFTLLFINVDGVSIYGPATIWCWISREYDWLRLVVVYAIIWIALSFSLVVYIAAARVIWKKRAQLDGFLNPWNDTPFATTVTTEVIITSESRGPDDMPMVDNPVIDIGDGPITDDKRQYSINIGSSNAQKQKLTNPINVRSITRDVARAEVNAESWLYARVAFLFFLALALNWIPASVFRIRDVMDPGSNNFIYGYIASFIFPLQGFWNALVYIITSRTACKQLWHSIRQRRYSMSEIGAIRPSRTSYTKRSQLGSWHTDEEALRPDASVSREVLSIKSSRTKLRQDSHESVPPVPRHDIGRRSAEADHDEPIDLSGYR